MTQQAQSAGAKKAATPMVGDLLFQRNLEFFRRHVPAMEKVIAKITPRGEFRIEANGESNLKLDGAWLYKVGADTDSRRQIEGFLRSPARILFADPNRLFQDMDEFKGQWAPPAEEFEFATQRYDDLNWDVHAQEFSRDAGKLIRDLAVKVPAAPPPNTSPYYLIILGVGLGRHIEPLVERLKPQMVVITESRPEMMYWASHCVDWRAITAKFEGQGIKLRMVFESDARKIVGKINGIVQQDCLLGLDGMMTFLHQPDPPLKSAFNEINSPRTGNWVSYIGFTTDEYNMMKNSFRNLRPGTKRILHHVRQKANVPVIIVGSGPSLEDNIDFIQANREKAIVISSGSSMASLLKHGIKPDFQAVLERAKAVYDRHQEAAAEFDLSEIHAILPSTVWPGIDAFFKDVVYFFRPALSPLAVFADDEAEILNGEGPQVTNTAFAFAKRLGFSEYYLVGLDLGAADPSKPRAEKAWVSPGVPQRRLNIPVRGNFGRTVFTDQALIQQRINIENQIRQLGAPVYNLSNGVRIAGAKPTRPEQVQLKPLETDRAELVQKLVEQFPVYTRERFLHTWESSGVRENVAEMVSALIRALEATDTWNAELLRKVHQINLYLGKPVRKQYAPRLLRGSVLRIFMYLNTLFLRLTPEKNAELYPRFRELLIEHLRRLEMEAYALADELEAEDEYFNA